MTTEQKPIPSGFRSTTTASEVIKGVDLTGKVAVVTGGSAGLGLETTRVLSQRGATVIVPARNLDKARRGVAGVERVELHAMDLMDPASIDSFAAAVVASGRAVHMLINNAGIMAAPLQRDARGNESHFSANHLGHFQLTMRLWPALLRAGGARVVSLSSRGHQRCGVDFDDPNFERRPYDRWFGYGQSKSANILFAVELDRRGRDASVRAFSCHPGAIITDLAVNMTDAEIAAYGLLRGVAAGTKPAGLSVEEGGDFKSIEQGAATTIWCATSPQLNGKGGVYCQDVDVAPRWFEGAPGNVGVKPYAVDPEGAGRLWALSERLLGATFTASR